MGKKRFRIIRYGDDEHYYYDTRVKTWIGWISFSVFFKTDIVHLISDASDQRALAYERIAQYCRIKGYDEKDILITELKEPRNRKWILHRMLSE